MRHFDLSFEFFLQKSLDTSFHLWNAVETLQVFSPNFMSITCGACGSTRDMTCSVVRIITENYDVPVVGHLTCVDATKDETLFVATG